MSKGADRSAKDKTMAAYMKARGVKRSSMRCPVCHNLIPILSLFSHFVGGCRAKRPMARGQEIR